MFTAAFDFDTAELLNYDLVLRAVQVCHRPFFRLWEALQFKDKRAILRQVMRNQQTDVPKRRTAEDLSRLFYPIVTVRIQPSRTDITILVAQ